MSDLWRIAFALVLVVVLAEALALFALARAIGLLYVRLGPERNALQTAEGLALYTEAPTVSGLDMRLRRPVRLDVSGGRWGLIFVSVTCGVCRDIVRDASLVAKDVGWGARMVVVSSGSDEQNEVLSKLAPDVALLSDSHGDMHKAYEVESTPYAFLIEGGHIQAKGIVNHRDQIEALLERKTTHRPNAVWLPADAIGVQADASPAIPSSEQ